jgi:hypothetical protein
MFTDREIAATIFKMEEDRLDYVLFDKWAGIDHLPNDFNKSLKRTQIVNRINTILNNGIEGSPHAYDLIVETKNVNFRRVPLQFSALQDIRSSQAKIFKRADEAAKTAAFALQRKSYYSLTDRKNIGLRKVSPEIDSGNRGELELAEKMLTRNNQILAVVFAQQEEAITTIQRLAGNAPRLEHAKAA